MTKKVHALLAKRDKDKDKSRRVKRKDKEHRETSHFAFKKGVFLQEHDQSRSAAQKEAYEKFVKEITTTGVEGLIKDYNEHVKAYVGTPMRREVFDKNMAKNRYKDVICNDLTRVVLNDGREAKEGDYIHANYLHGLHSTFILTQGPKENTCFDFWRMILQEKVGVICMLCEAVEFGRPKCYQYWPVKVGDSVTFGDITITSSSVDATDAHISKSLLRVESNGKRTTVGHLHSKSWPDKSVPSSNMAVLRLLHYLRSCDSTIVVHCSAGIGRTGTLVAVEACLQTLHDEKPLNLAEICKIIRNARMSCVQVEVQYLALAECIAEFGYAMKYWEDADLYSNFQLLKLNIGNYVASKGPEGMQALQRPLVEPLQLPLAEIPKQEKEKDEDSNKNKDKEEESDSHRARKKKGSIEEPEKNKKKRSPKGIPPANNDFPQSRLEHTAVSGVSPAQQDASRTDQPMSPASKRSTPDPDGNRKTRQKASRENRPPSREESRRTMKKNAMPSSRSHKKKIEKRIAKANLEAIIKLKRAVDKERAEKKECKDGVCPKEQQPPSNEKDKERNERPDRPDRQPPSQHIDVQSEYL